MAGGRSVLLECHHGERHCPSLRVREVVGDVLAQADSVHVLHAPAGDAVEVGWDEGLPDVVVVTVADVAELGHVVGGVIGHGRG